MTEIYYIKILFVEDGRKAGIILYKKKPKEFASAMSCRLWLNKNESELSEGAIYTPTMGFKK